MAPASAHKTSVHPQIGDEMPDGTIYAGISPDTNKPMYAMPDDAPGTYNFQDANNYASVLDLHGHCDWRLPTKAELNILFDNRIAIGGFNLAPSSLAAWYWSSLESYDWLAWVCRFSDGFQFFDYRGSEAALRCVR
jgi:hypothetical protein